MNPSDIGTKALGRERFHRLRSMLDVALDLTSLTYQPTTNSSARYGHPKRQVTCAMSELNPAYPAHALLEQEVSKDSREREQRKPRFWAKRQKVKRSETLSTSCLTSVTCRTFT